MRPRVAEAAESVLASASGQLGARPGSSMRCVTGHHASRAGRWWGRTALALAAGTATALTGCAKTPPLLDPPASAVPASPSASPVEPAPSEPVPPSGTPSATPPETPSSTPGVTATGSLTLYREASKAMTGSCRTSSGIPTLTVADRTNEFFGSVDATLLLSERRTTVAKLTIALGEDSELVTRTLTYDAANPGADTSVDLTGKGSAFVVSGKLTSTENGKVAGTIPVKLTIECSGRDW